MNRLAATQHWPVLFILPQTAHLTVLSSSASSSTMKASLPPSSMVDFLRFCPPGGDNPAGSTLPVKRHTFDAGIVNHPVHLII
jgi:hypothetical protein